MNTSTQKKPPRTAKGNNGSPAKEQIIFTGQDRIIRDMVYAPSKEIDAIAANLIIRDTGYIIEYLKQKINLEQKYIEEHNTINKNLNECCAQHNISGIQKSFMEYVGLSDILKPMREKHIETLKQQRDSLIAFRNEQQKAAEKNRLWMNQSNQEYIIARLKKLPTAKEIYSQIWDEIEKSNGATVSSPLPMTPVTPTLSVGSTLTGSSVPVLHKKSSHDEDLDIRAMSMDDDRTRKFSDPVNSPPQSSRIERFMKKHLNKPENPTNQNIKIAKLKVEVGEADTNYRNVVREISTLSIKTDATNFHILNNVQLALKEKAEKVKALLQLALKADLQQLQQTQQPIISLLESVQQADTLLESKNFTTASNNAFKNFMKPTPIYYQNHHVGVCKDLIFGISLTEYAQQRNRSPPLLITKCIDAIERLGGLEREGIYRVSGKQSNIEKIKHAFELDEQAVVIGENEVPEDIFAIASVIKIFLRELKTPLFPFKLTDRLVYSQIPDQELRLMNLLTRLLKLQPANYDTLKVLIHHLSKLQACVEKNKMTTSNLTLIFTPAIFQDLNHAQNSPGEWHKDCVLEDLIMNNQDIFANKDLHNNSAITGHIEYGFNHNDTDSHEEHHHINRYAMTVQSPDSPTGQGHERDDDEYSFVDDDDESDIIRSVHDSSNASSTLHLGVEQILETVSSRPTTPDFNTESPPSMEYEQQVVESITQTNDASPSRQTSVERRKYQNHFQGMGLKVDTGNAKPTGFPNREMNKDHLIPTIKSATVPSYDWLKHDPENSNNPPVPTVPKLRRSATTGKKFISRRKVSLHHTDGDIPDVPILKRGGNNSTSTTTIP